MAANERIAVTLASLADLPGSKLELLTFPSDQPGQCSMLSLLLRSDVDHPGVWSPGAIDFTVVELWFVIGCGGTL